MTTGIRSVFTIHGIMERTRGMNTSEAAAKLGTEARILRRFLRADPTYNNPGSSGRYEFTTNDIPTMRRRFEAWQSTQTSIPSKPSNPPKPKVEPMTEVNPSEGPDKDLEYDLECGFGGYIPNRLRGELRDRENARVARLEERLLAAGLHISQHRR